MLNAVGHGYYDEAEKAAAAGRADVALEKNKAAIKYLEMLTKRDDVKPADFRDYGLSALALKDSSAASPSSAVRTS